MFGGFGYIFIDLGLNYVKIWGLFVEVIVDIFKLNGWVICVQVGFDRNSLLFGRKFVNVIGFDNVIIEGQIQFLYGNVICFEFVVFFFIVCMVIND